MSFKKLELPSNLFVFTKTQPKLSLYYGDQPFSPHGNLFMFATKPKPIQRGLLSAEPGGCFFVNPHKRVSLRMSVCVCAEWGHFTDHEE